MEDLIKKIEELRDLVKGMFTKPNQNSLVPAIKQPTLKPLSMPSIKSSASPKIPGIAPPSNKDPKKMAEQLKNPRPKKPKTEMIKFDSGGQWSLHKDESGITLPDGK
jgi:hypothetical protein